MARLRGSTGTPMAVVYDSTPHVLEYVSSPIMLQARTCKEWFVLGPLRFSNS